MMKPYLLFAGCDYYPDGGVGDLIAAFETAEEAEEWGAHNRYDWWQVVRHVDMEVVAKSGDRMRLV